MNISPLSLFASDRSRTDPRDENQFLQRTRTAPVHQFPDCSRCALTVPHTVANNPLVQSLAICQRNLQPLRGLGICKTRGTCTSKHCSFMNIETSKRLGLGDMESGGNSHSPCLHSLASKHDAKADKAIFTTSEDVLVLIRTSQAGPDAFPQDEFSHQVPKTHYLNALGMGG